MTRTTVARPVAVLPRPGYLAAAVGAGGGRVTTAGDAEALVWTDHRDPDGLAAVLDEHPHLLWVQLPWAGIEPYLDVVRRVIEEDFGPLGVAPVIGTVPFECLNQRFESPGACFEFGVAIGDAVGVAVRRRFPQVIHRE